MVSPCVERLKAVPWAQGWGPHACRAVELGEMPTATISSTADVAVSPLLSTLDEVVSRA